ncbi:MAG: class I SAM-dependent methyltransferase [Deltaproteobacteria bacterium]|nr:class I SAM-dependent methyltransferase [Deltaproteobacteria bacterium]
MLNFLLLVLMKVRGYLPVREEDLERERDIWQEERENLQREREALHRERDIWRQEREIWQRERENLRREREALHQKLEAAQQRVQQLEHDQFLGLLSSPQAVPPFINMIVQGVLRKHHRSVFWGDRLLTLDKSAGFWEDARFPEAYEQIKGSNIYDQYSGPDGIAWRLHVLIWAVRSVIDLPGDFVECGVFKGDMSWVVAQTTNFSSQNRKFYLYDTFAGFSPDYSSKEDFPFNPQFFDYANQIYRIPDLYEKVKARFKSFPNCMVIRGTLPDILSETAPEKIAFLHLDLNSPAAETGVLEVLFDRLPPGGILILDDYGWLEYIKQKRAADKFMSDRGYPILELPTGQGLVIKR